MKTEYQVQIRLSKNDKWMLFTTKPSKQDAKLIVKSINYVHKNIQCLIVKIKSK